MPQTSGFRSAKQILVVSFATQARAFILSDRNTSYTPGGGGGEEQRRGLMPLGLFLFVFVFFNRSHILVLQWRPYLPQHLVKSYLTLKLVLILCCAFDPVVIRCISGLMSDCSRKIVKCRNE